MSDLVLVVGNRALSYKTTADTAISIEQVRAFIDHVPRTQFSLHIEDESPRGRLLRATNRLVLPSARALSWCLVHL